MFAFATGSNLIQYLKGGVPEIVDAISEVVPIFATPEFVLKLQNGKIHIVS